MTSARGVIFTDPAADLAAVTKRVGEQLRDELERVARSTGMAVPGFLILTWDNERPGVNYSSNRVNEEYVRAIEVVAKHHGLITWRIGKGGAKT